MKRLITTLVLAIAALGANAQSSYWVFLTDKAGTTFDPYSYFDSKAIERYRLNNADLYDITNYPLNDSYVRQIDDLVADDFGQSRWFNAVAVTATPEQIEAVQSLPFVREVVLLGSDMQVAEETSVSSFTSNVGSAGLTDQLLRMQGQLFVDKGIDGTGIRIAVFDGGFHAVNTHQAFKHLRDNGRIIATWDFTKKQEDVYDNHGHGTMVLSCIAGKIGDKQLGLATGATFLLAKTEVDPEPFKEEVWWAQAVEWADKNGADIINSSLGYTKDRHYTWQMDGRSYVSKAANIAARKGILVCNSAGNSGEDNNWKIIGAPADADSILSVGGIAHSLTSYKHIGFSSYGPTADGRLKPNVCSFGIAEVAKPYNDTAVEYNAGTSFSAPLTTGFCACAMQTVRDEKPTAMQMKALIEQSADLYPYYDYALGYGVPQASFFIDKNSRNDERISTFRFEDTGAFVVIHPKPLNNPRTVKTVVVDNGVINAEEKEDVVMFKVQDCNGLIQNYVNLGIVNLDDKIGVAIPKSAISGKTLVAHVNGYTESYRLSKQDSAYYSNHIDTFEYYVIDTAGYILDSYEENGNRCLADNKVSNWGVGQRHLAEMHAQFGTLWTFGDANMKYSFGTRFGIRYLYSFKKWYSLGVGIDVGTQDFIYRPENLNTWDNSLGLPVNNNVVDRDFDFGCTSLELFQRVRFKAGGSFRHKGFHWDLGVYGGVQYSTYMVTFNENENANSGGQVNYYYSVKPADKLFQWGLTTRLVWDFIGIYGRYRMSQPDLDLPRLEFGIQISL